MSGNIKTKDHVIYREIRTRPGDCSAERTVQPEQLNYQEPPHQPDQHQKRHGIEYTVAAPSDQIERPRWGRTWWNLGLISSAGNMFKA